LASITVDRATGPVLTLQAIEPVAAAPTAQAPVTTYDQAVDQVEALRAATVDEGQTTMATPRRPVIDRNTLAQYNRAEELAEHQDYAGAVALLAPLVYQSSGLGGELNPDYDLHRRLAQWSQAQALAVLGDDVGLADSPGPLSVKVGSDNQLVVQSAVLEALRHTAESYGNVWQTAMTAPDATIEADYRDAVLQEAGSGIVWALATYKALASRIQSAAVAPLCADLVASLVASGVLDAADPRAAGPFGESDGPFAAVVRFIAPADDGEMLPRWQLWLVEQLAGANHFVPLDLLGQVGFLIGEEILVQVLGQGTPMLQGDGTPVTLH
jgi:hypothetical protein